MCRRSEMVLAYIEARESVPIHVLRTPAGIAVLEGGLQEGAQVVASFWFAKSHHAEMVLADIGRTDPTITADDLRDTIVNAAANLGAPWQTSEEITAGAEAAVDEIMAKVEASRVNGELRQVNAAYKIYRQRQSAKGEKAMPYAAHLATFTRSLVTLAAKNAR